MKFSTKDIDLRSRFFSSVYACGDIHGSFDTFIFDLKRKKIRNAAVIICGDISLGFSKPAYYYQVFKSMQSKLYDLNVTVLMFRGNHDDPAWFSFNDAGFDYDYPNIVVLDDYSVVQLKDDLSVLVIGGAVSIDRKLRELNGYKHWAGEKVRPPEKGMIRKFCSLPGRRIVCSHTAPDFVNATAGNAPADVIENFISLGDKNLRGDIDKDRKTLTRCRELMNPAPELWLYGHFHAHAEETAGGVKYVMLDRLRDNISHTRHDTTIPDSDFWLKRDDMCDWYKVL